MNTRQDSGFVSVLYREIDRMVSRRLYFGVCIILPLFCILFISTIFGSGQMENIPVGVVDLDNSATSRNIVRSVEAVPTFNVIKHYEDAVSARTATQRKEIYGYLVIPYLFESNLLANRNTTLSYYYHYALLSVGGEVRGAFESLLQPLSLNPIVAAAMDSGISEQAIENFLVPVNTQSHPLYNADLDYSVYLCQPFLFIFFQVIVLLLTVYVIGSEIKFGTAGEWLRSADMNIVIAVVAKLLPYTVIFIIMGIFGNYVLFGIMRIPFSCGFLPLNIATALFIIATQALGVFLFSLFPAISIIISIVSMVGSLGATLSGVTFPVPFMFPLAYYASFLFPVRHFVEISQNMLYGDYGFAYSWQSISVLLLFILAAMLLLPRLKGAIINHKYENIE